MGMMRRRSLNKPCDVTIGQYNSAMVNTIIHGMKLKVTCYNPDASLCRVLLPYYYQSCARSTSNISAYDLGIWTSCSLLPSGIVTTKASRTGVNPLNEIQNELCVLCMIDHVCTLLRAVPIISFRAPSLALKKHLDLCVFSIPISLVMIKRIYIYIYFVLLSSSNPKYELSPIV